VGTQNHVRTDLRRSSGFSLLEMLVVLAITLVVAAMAMPMIGNMVSAYQVRQSAAELAGLFQRARIAAVRSNQAVRVRTATVSGRQQVYVDLPGGTAGTIDPGEPTVVLPRKVAILTAGPGDPTATLTANNVTWNTTDAQFNGRGLPCVTSGAVCVNLIPAGTQQGFEYWLRSDGIFGATHWSAVVITPAGRVKSMMYSGSSYN
jgi:prepilin-type N-terminal cleavage/methylation domain-containing protein